MFKNFEHQKRKNTLNLYSLFSSEAKGVTNFAKGGNWLFPHRIFDFFLFQS